MKNLAICYGENAIKASDAYCIGPASQAYISSNSTPANQECVVSTYKVKLSTQKQFLIKLTWSKTLGFQCFKFCLSDFPCSPSKFRKNSREFNKVKGRKDFEAFKSKIEIFWDFSNAIYESSGPEPKNRFTIVLLINSEACLVLGDAKEKLKTMKDDNSNIKVAKYSLVSKVEYFSGNKNAVFSTTIKFCETGTLHDISIKWFGEDSIKGLKNSGLSVFIDKKNVVHVKRLQWNFRGNQTIFIDGLLIDMMWDVHNWLHNGTNMDNNNTTASNNEEFRLGGVFMFRTRSGLDSRLWLEEKNLEEKEQDKAGFSLLICACKNPD